MIELFTVKDLLDAVKEKGISFTRPKFNQYEKMGFIPELTYMTHVHKTNHFNNTGMRLFTKEEIAKIVEIVIKTETVEVK